MENPKDTNYYTQKLAKIKQIQKQKIDLRDSESQDYNVRDTKAPMDSNRASSKKV